MTITKVSKLEYERIRYGNLLGQYQNGNYEVRIYESGTKIRENNLDFFEAAFPESMDCKITNQCPMGCPMCHEKSTPNGDHGDIMNTEFINKLRKGTEMAIGGGAVTSHPDLVPFLRKLKKIGVIPSITVHQKEYKDHRDLVDGLVQNKLVYGLGISFHSMDDEFWDDVLQNSNTVVHLIAGIHGSDVYEYLAQRNAKILILGYKDFGRGRLLLETDMGVVINAQKQWLKENIKDYMPKFKVVSFDNLAIVQLDVQNILTNEQWNDFYQGDDGTHTMYVDLVKQEFALTSTTPERYALLDNIDDMFNILKNKKEKTDMSDRNIWLLDYLKGKTVKKSEVVDFFTIENKEVPIEVQSIGNEEYVYTTNEYSYKVTYKSVPNTLTTFKIQNVVLL